MARAHGEEVAEEGPVHPGGDVPALLLEDGRELDANDGLAVLRWLVDEGQVWIAVMVEQGKELGLGYGHEEAGAGKEGAEGVVLRQDASGGYHTEVECGGSFAEGEPVGCESVLVGIAGGVVGLGGGAKDAGDRGEEDKMVEVAGEELVEVPGAGSFGGGAQGEVGMGHVFEDGVLVVVEGLSVPVGEGVAWF